ncbi:MAG: cold-shock protein [Chloroflexi bacterium B3_Chlor]|nr:MAG: cold-shock protein [Chloroflexi bacterium B3_Chlor]
MAERLTGLVRWFNPRRGYGFIQPPEGEDVFVHYSEIRGDGFKTLYEGEEVEFTTKEAPKGPQAVDVVRLNIYSPPYEEES